jgi:hypothetical protein
MQKRIDEELVAYTEKLAEADRQMKAMGEEIVALANALEEANQQIAQLIEQHSQSDAERNKFIEKLLTSNGNLEARMRHQANDIAILSSELDQRDEASGGQLLRWPLTGDQWPDPNLFSKVIGGATDPQGNRLLYAFYNGYDLEHRLKIQSKVGEGDM